MVFVRISFFLFFIFGIFLLYREGLLKGTGTLILSLLLLCGALILRVFLFSAESDDYLDFLLPWVNFFRDNGGFKALGTHIGNYNPPYLYFLALFSYFDVNPLYLIKLLSVLFDILLAWACTKLASLYEKNSVALLVCFFIVLFLPTVVLNGAYWGQCDSIYCFFAVMGLYLALSGKPVGSMLCITASFAFKLQAVFILPVYFILLLAKKIKPEHLLIFPAAYILYMVPVFLAGGSFADTLTLYVSQAGTVGDAMNYNAPSLTSMFSWQGDTALWSKLLIVGAFAVLFILYAAAIVKRKSLDDRVLLAFAVLIAVAIPFILPHMHDRYFYPAGILLVILFISDPRYFAAPLFAELASLHCYYAYFARRYLVDPRYGGLLMLLVLLMCVLFLSCEIKKSGKLKNNP